MMRRCEFGWKLKADYVRVIQDLDNKRVNRKEDHRLQNHLAKRRITAMRKVQSLIPGSLMSQMPQPILTRDESQFLVRDTKYPVLTDILRVRICGQGSIG